MSTCHKITLILTRDSVCAGDDADAPHERTVEVIAFTDTLEFMDQFSTGYLASVNGIGHSWTAHLNGRPVAVIRVNGIEPLVPSIDFGDHNTLFFEYHSATY